MERAGDVRRMVLHLTSALLAVGIWRGTYQSINIIYPTAAPPPPSSSWCCPWFCLCNLRRSTASSVADGARSVSTSKSAGSGVEAANDGAATTAVGESVGFRVGTLAMLKRLTAAPLTTSEERVKRKACFMLTTQPMAN